jgi:purine-binding chemotaxis protein CheW
MSDFFGDDFTAELKTYFLDSLNKEVAKFLDLVDESTWRRLINELDQETQTWIADAITNEFTFLAGWIEEFKKSLPDLAAEAELQSALSSLKSYIDALLIQKADSAELAQSYSWQKSSSATKQFLHCRIGEQEFVLPVMNVVEIVSGDRKVSPIPVVKDQLAGVIPYRGEAIPVFDLTHFGFQDVHNLKTYFVICENAGAMFALQVTGTDELLTLEGHTFQDVDQGATLLRAPFISHFFVRDNRSIMILDLEKLVA